MSESPIIFTENCCIKVKDLIAEENNPDLKLRVFVNGGGCSGFQYGFSFDEIVNEDDFAIEKDDWKRMIDIASQTKVFDSLELANIKTVQTSLSKKENVKEQALVRAYESICKLKRFGVYL